MDPEPDSTPFHRSAATASEPKLTVEIVRRAGSWPSGGFDALLTRVAEAAFAAAHPACEAEVAVVLTDDAEIRTLNAQWRGKDKATNVLSFPLHDETDMTAGAAIALGDVVLAQETVLREAGGRDLPFGDHAAHLVVHGVLHLMGYDHANNAEARLMEALESRVMIGFGLADPYADTDEESGLVMTQEPVE